MSSSRHSNKSGKLFPSAKRKRRVGDNLKELHKKRKLSQIPEVSQTSNMASEDNDQVVNEIKENSLPSGRFICDLAYVIEQARALENHKLSCNYGGSYVFQKIRRFGLLSELVYRCSKKECENSEIIRTDKDRSINRFAVLGALCCGSGFSLEEEKFSSMEINYMSQPTFSKYEIETGNWMEACLEENIVSAIETEKELSSKRNDVDDNGFHCISAIIDGGWCKRTYGHGYNASSGVAVIIGAETKKIIFIGIRNKLCLICKALKKKEENRQHVCFKNWDGSSTAMESDIIVEGMKYLEEMHGVKCTRLIGDGDSNTMALVQKNISYGNQVLKVECANHAVRRYLRNLQRIQKSTLKYPGPDGSKARKKLKALIPRLVKGARSAIKKHEIQNHQADNSDTTKKLVEELQNAPNHVFGNHEKCGDFCKKKDEASNSETFNMMSKSGILIAVNDAITKNLVSCANTLVWNATNNQAEHYMSQFCKTIGGKRVDHSKSGSINRRAKIAALAYQSPAQAWHQEAHEALARSTPRTPLRKFLLARRKKYLTQVRRRKLFPRRKVFQSTPDEGGDSSYGLQPDQPDLPEEAMKTLGEAYLRDLGADAAGMPRKTIGQYRNPVWREERAKRLSSSFFKDVGSRRAATPCGKLVKRIVYGGMIGTEAVRYGNEHEPAARSAYEQATGKTVSECGLFLDATYPFLCTSPDGLVGEEGLIEIKCPFTARDATSLNDEKILERVGIKNNVMSKNHRYYFQVQGQLNITKRNWCDFVVWCKNDLKILRIHRNREFWEQLIPKLNYFYINCILPELINPRHPRKLPIREPLNSL